MGAGAGQFRSRRGRRGPGEAPLHPHSHPDVESRAKRKGRRGGRGKEKEKEIRERAGNMGSWRVGGDLSGGYFFGSERGGGFLGLCIVYRCEKLKPSSCEKVRPKPVCSMYARTALDGLGRRRMGADYPALFVPFCFVAWGVCDRDRVEWGLPADAPARNAGRSPKEETPGGGNAGAQQITVWARGAGVPRERRRGGSLNFCTKRGQAGADNTKSANKTKTTRPCWECARERRHAWINIRTLHNATWKGRGGGCCRADWRIYAAGYQWYSRRGLVGRTVHPEQANMQYISDRMGAGTGQFRSRRGRRGPGEAPLHPPPDVESIIMPDPPKNKIEEEAGEGEEGKSVIAPRCELGELGSFGRGGNSWVAYRCKKVRPQTSSRISRWTCHATTPSPRHVGIKGWRESGTTRHCRALDYKAWTAGCRNAHDGTCNELRAAPGREETPVLNKRSAEKTGGVAVVVPGIMLNRWTIGRR
ncbi:hypothetical protein B0H17DRAFT_1143845 [Mycena rosella]|uniref:Uncharacterized protein n=1 Tax=Mycena rosella TaxID=1033263 RepID=A0AAD7CUE9_MYCRO|nr:hypothetical protein B0H17DRAFT_1143845 [Mycena rosella]